MNVEEGEEIMMKIVRMTEADISAVAPLVAQFRVTLKSFKGIAAAPDVEAGASELKEYLDAGFPVFVAIQDGVACGYLVCRVEEPCVWVESIYVLPEFRKQVAPFPGRKAPGKPARR